MCVHLQSWWLTGRTEEGERTNIALLAGCSRIASSGGGVLQRCRKIMQIVTEGISSILHKFVLASIINLPLDLPFKMMPNSSSIRFLSSPYCQSNKGRNERTLRRMRGRESAFEKLTGTPPTSSWTKYCYFLLLLPTFEAGRMHFQGRDEESLLLSLCIPC